MTDQTVRVERTIEADVKAIDAACQELRAALLSGLPEADRFSVELLLREALTNAVFHRSPAARGTGIWYEVAFLPGEIVIRVDDGGEGFEWRDWRPPELPPVEEHGLGLHILHRYASRVRFSGNGSAVELVRTLQEGQSYEH